MNEYNSIETTNRTSLTNQTKFRLSEISKIEKYCNSENKERKLNSKKLGKYVAAFDYTDEILHVLSATNGGVSIISFATVIGFPVGIASVSFTLIFSLTIGIIKKLLITTRNKKKKHDRIFVLTKIKFNSIETLVSQALVDTETSHAKFTSILKEKDRYEK